MGAANSKTAEQTVKQNDQKQLLLTTINKISSSLILNTNNEDLIKFMEPDHCEKIINLTSNILNDNFTKNQLRIINENIKQTNNNIKQTNNNIKQTNNNIKYGESDNTFESLNDVKPNDKIYETKQKICNEISVYYVKIAHIFSAIKTIIDSDKPICNKKEMFKYKEDKSKPDYNATISSEICTRKNTNNTDTLEMENGIPELENLYKDKYDNNNNIFVMSEASKINYEADLINFYKSYTGNKKPENIKRFSDIPVFEYKSMELCNKMKEKSSGILKGTTTNNNIINFANHLAEIMNKSSIFDKQLIDILNYIFVPDGDEYIINEKITFDAVDQLIKRVREIIMEIYIICEKDYRTGLELFEKILLDKNIELAVMRINFGKEIDAKDNKIKYEEKKMQEDDEAKIQYDKEKEEEERNKNNEEIRNLEKREYEEKAVENLNDVDIKNFDKDYDADENVERLMELMQNPTFKQEFEKNIPNIKTDADFNLVIAEILQKMELDNYDAKNDVENDAENDVENGNESIASNEELSQLNKL
jgi:hypothetical protein